MWRSDNVPTISVVKARFHMTKWCTFTNAKLRGRKFGSAPPRAPYLLAHVGIYATHKCSTSEISSDTTEWGEQGVSNSSARVGVGIRVVYVIPREWWNIALLLPVHPFPFIKVISSASLRAHFLNSTRLFHYHTLHPGILSSINSRGCSRIAAKSRLLPAKLNALFNIIQFAEGH